MTDVEGNVTCNSSTMDHYEYFECLYDYEYSYEDSVQSVPLPELIPVAIVYCITLLVGVVGNSLVIFSIAYYGRLHNVTNVFLLSLASADLLLVLICVPIKFAAFYTFTWDYGEFLCKYVHYMQNVSMISSIWTLTVMSIERFIAIRYPLKAKYVCTITHARLVVIGVWIISFVFAVPIIFGRIHKEVGEVRKVHWCIKEWSWHVYSIMYEMYMFVFMFLIPLLLMVVAYSFICAEVWKVASIRANMRSGRVISTSHCTSYMRGNVTRWDNHDASTPLTNQKKHKKTFSDDKETRKQPMLIDKMVSENEFYQEVVIMLMVVVLLFAICWAPILFNNVLTAFGVLEHHHFGWVRFMRLAFFLMSYVNSCINPVVYAFMSKNFRQTFKYAVCACVKGKAFIRAYRFSRSFNSTRTSTMHTNGRIIYPQDKDNPSNGGSANTVTRVTPPSEYIELDKMMD